MPTFTQLDAHIVFSTKGRKNQIDPSWEDDLYGYIGGIIRQEKCVLPQAGGMPDHIHLLVGFRPSIALSDLLRTIKSNSTNWMHEVRKIPDFAWQEGYSAFSVSRSLLPKVQTYISSQKEHHQQRDYMAELCRLLEVHQVPFEEHFLFPD